MNFALTRKSLLAYLTPLAVIFPSLIWIALDKSVWTWDPALYGKSSVELFFNLVYAPTDWISQMLDVLGGHAPAISWFGQFFVPLGYLLGSVDVGLLVFIRLTQAITLMVNAIVSKTCRESRQERYWNIVGDQKPWLNVNTLAYTAAKKLAPENRERCNYGYLGYVVSDLDETWKHVLSLNPRYYITSDPEIYPISADKLDQAVNQLNVPVLKKVQASGLFELEVALREIPGILIFRRNE
jgi:hypothetical protein